MARRLIERAAVPALILIATFLLPRYMLPGSMAAMLPEEGPGPTLWPNVMLTLIAICAFVWLVLIVWSEVRAPAAARAEYVEAPEEVYSHRLAWAGIGIVLIYGVAIQYLGFAFATLAFLAVWCLLGGVRKPLTLVPVAVLGTLVLLWVFVALAQMPLDRGRGAFTAATDELYDVIGIY